MIAGITVKVEIRGAGVVENPPTDADECPPHDESECTPEPEE
jgi:hypothetical protein